MHPCQGWSCCSSRSSRDSATARLRSYLVYHVYDIIAKWPPLRKLDANASDFAATILCCVDFAAPVNASNPAAACECTYDCSTWPIHLILPHMWMFRSCSTCAWLHQIRYYHTHVQMHLILQHLNASDPAARQIDLILQHLDASNPCCCGWLIWSQSSSGSRWVQSTAPTSPIAVPDESIPVPNRFLTPVCSGSVRFVLVWPQAWTGWVLTSLARNTASGSEEHGWMQWSSMYCWYKFNCVRFWRREEEEGRSNSDVF
jgi:hypothetical protein